MTTDRAAVEVAIERFFAEHGNERCHHVLSVMQAKRTCPMCIAAALVGPPAPPPPGGEGETVERVRALLPKVTPGPWVVETQSGGDYGEYDYITGHVTAKAHAYCGNTAGRTDSVTAPDSMTQADAHFIAAARDAIPALLAAVERRWQDGYEAGCAAAHDIGCSAVEGERDALREQVERLTGERDELERQTRHALEVGVDASRLLIKVADERDAIREQVTAAATALVARKPCGCVIGVRRLGYREAHDAEFKEQMAAAGAAVEAVLAVPGRVGEPLPRCGTHAAEVSS